MLMTGCRYVTAKPQCKYPRGLKEGKMAKIEPPSPLCISESLHLSATASCLVVERVPANTGNAGHGAGNLGRGKELSTVED